MVRLSSLLVAVASLSFPPSTASAQGVTCDPASLNGDSYRLTTEAQALNVTRPRTDWWDGFDASLGHAPGRAGRPERGRPHHRRARAGPRSAQPSSPIRSSRGNW